MPNDPAHPESPARLRVELNSLVKRLDAWRSAQSHEALELAAQIAALEQRLRGLETVSEPGSPVEEQSSRPFETTRPDTPVEQEEALEAELVPALEDEPRLPSAASSTPNASPPETARPPSPKPTREFAPTPSPPAAARPALQSADDGKETISWEAFIGTKGLTWAGALVLLVAVGFGVHWAWITFETPDWLKVTMLHAMGVGLVAAGVYFQVRRLPIIAQGLLGVGIFSLYAVALATLRLFEFTSEPFAFAEFAAITVLAVGLALWTDSIAVILLGALGGYLAPVLTSSGSGDHVALFVYLAFLNVAILSCAVWKGWNFLKPLTLLATALMFLVWLETGFLPEDMWSTEWLLVLHTAIFLASTTIPPWFWRQASRPADLLTLSGSSMWFLGMTWQLFHDQLEQQLALVCWGMAALHLVLFVITYARVTHADRMPRVQLALSAVFITLAAPLQLNEIAYLGPAWCVEGLIFTVVGIYFRDLQMRASALAVFVLAATRLLGLDFTSAARMAEGTQVDLRFAVILCGGLIALATGGLYGLFAEQLSKERRFLDIDFDQVARRSLLLIGVVLVTAAIPLQLSDLTYLGPAWCVEALIFTVVGIYFRDIQMRASALAVFALAATRLLGLDFTSAARMVEGTQVDIRFAVILCGGLLALATGGLYGLFAKQLSKERRDWEADFNLYARRGLLVLGAVLITAAVPLQLAELIYLGPAWSLVALAFVMLGVGLRSVTMRAVALPIFALAAGRLMGFDFESAAQTWGTSNFDLRFAVIGASGLLAMSAGGLVVATRRWIGAQNQIAEFDRLSAGALLAAGNLLLMASVTRQWVGREVLLLWTIDAAAVWALGFSLRKAAVRWYGLLLGVGLVGGRAVYELDRLDGEFSLLTNARFVSLALVAAMYFAFGWLYRRQRLGADQAGDLGRPNASRPELQEAWIDPVLGTLANVVLVAALTLEVRDWFNVAIDSGRAPFFDMQMAQLAAYSILWAVYAAVLVGAGFVLRYRLFRLLGLAAFPPILAKVFFVDLAELQWMPRVLAFAVLGIMMLAVSWIYQRYTARLTAT